MHRNITQTPAKNKNQRERERERNERESEKCITLLLHTHFSLRSNLKNFHKPKTQKKKKKP